MNWVQIVPSVLLWIAFGARLSWMLVKTNHVSKEALKSGRIAGGRLHKALLLAAMAATLNIDEVYLWIDPQIGAINVLNLVVHGCLGLGLTELSMSLAKAAGVSKQRGKMLFWAGTLLVSAQAILLFASFAKGSATDFTETFGHMPLVALYESLFFAWVAVICARTGMVLRHRKRSGESAVFRSGMDIVSASCVSAGIGSASKLGLLLVAMLGADARVIDPLKSTYALMIGLTCVGFALGLGMPAVEKMRQSVRDREWRANVSADLRKTIERVCETEVGRQVVQLSGRVPAGSSLKDIYAMDMVLRDVQAYGDDILSASELRFLDEVEERIVPLGLLRRASVPRS